MAIKDLAYTIKQSLESVTHSKFQHTHVYELLASCMGFKSSAAMNAKHVLVVLQRPSEPSPAMLVQLQARLVDLGYRTMADEAGSELLKVVTDLRLGVVPIASVISTLEDSRWAYDPAPFLYADDDTDEFDEEFGPSIDLKRTDILLEGLNSAARRGNAAAHYALAHIHAEDDLPGSEGSEYWYSMMKQGRVLDGVELEWALAYKEGQGRAERQAFHVAEAARLGHPKARLALTIAKAHEAEAEGDFENAKIFHMEAASLGEVESMLTLIEDYGQPDPLQSWVWVYLSELLGSDLRKSSLRAYHEGGIYADQEYDDDQGGPMYVDGFEGVKLAPLSQDSDATARRLAAEFFEKIEESKNR